MTRRFIIRLAFLLSGTIALLGTGCRRDSTEVSRSLGFDDFMPVYNRYISGWLKSQQETTEKELKRIEAELTTADDKAKTALQNQLEMLQHDQEKWTFRLSIGDYLKIGNPAEIPANRHGPT